MGLSKEEAQKQAEKEYQEALENLDFSKKYIIRIGYDGREITGYPFTAIMRSDYDRQRKDVMASPRITIMDIAKGVEAQKDWSDWRCVDEDFMNTPVIKNNAEAHPEDWGKIVKTFLWLRGSTLGSTLRKAEDFMLHSPLVTSEKLRQQVKILCTLVLQ